jgi:hypothetical protein
MVRVRIVVLVALVLTVAACSSAQTVPPTTQNGVASTTAVPPTTQPTPAVDLSATPVGWVPVAYGDAQLSVPSSWYVSYRLGCYSGNPPGVMTVDPILASINCGAETFPEPRTTVSLGPATVRNEDQPPTALGHRMVINGISVLHDAAGSGGTYIGPSLGVEISVGGVLGQRVLHTLTRSPRAVALAKGPAPSVPSSWRSVTLGGVRLSVPASWPVQSESLFFLTCFSGPAEGYSLSHASVVLDTDVAVDVHGCPAARNNAPPLRSPSNGLRIDTGPAFLRVQTFRFASGNCLDLHGLTACPATSPDYSILVLRVTEPGRSKPVFVSIGLAGDGMVARTILYSLRPA